MVDEVVLCLVETLLVLLLVGVPLIVETKARHAVRIIDRKCMVEGCSSSKADE